MMIDSTNSQLLIMRFNARETEAFAQVYRELYNQLHCFASNVFKGVNVNPSDIIHDTFISIWKNDKITFSSLNDLRAYMFVCVKNAVKNILSHNKHRQKYVNNVSENPQLLMVEIVVSGVLSIASQITTLLPDDCANIIRYHLEGWTSQEIAQKMGVSERTVYSKKSEAIKILQNKVNRSDLLSLLMLLP